MDGTDRRAERLEELLPMVMRAVHRSDENDPLAELPIVQLRVLRVLESGSRTLSDLAHEMGMSLSGLSQVTHRMEMAGLLDRTEDEHDRRVRHVTVSAHAEELMRVRRACRTKRVAEVLRTMSESDQKNTLDALEVFLKAARSVPGKGPNSVSVLDDIERPLPIDGKGADER